MGTPTQVCVWSCPNFSAPAGRPFRCVSDIWLLISGDAKIATLGWHSEFPPLLGCDRLGLSEPRYDAKREEGVDGLREGNDERVKDLNGQGNEHGLGANEENMWNVLVNENWVGYSYKEYDGKGGAVVLTCWMEKMENVQDMSGCSNDQTLKYTAGSFVAKALTWWNSQICTLSQEIAC
ncbi:hypothetical protein Tco_0908843 [Tanacetum coccineum]|uniref:Reverse transcriptase domain-containing protein n=1 Tax=Tanacetum coccineum TaxID=301880 RepID=A0ABQ5CNY6_9ASTR